MSPTSMSPATKSLLEISHGQYSAGIDPNVGGSLAYWRTGHDLVRPAGEGETDPGQFGCFPLVPYSNRIRDGRFEFGGQTIQLPLNFGDHPHSIHGHGWQGAWDVVSQGPSEARLQFRHEAGDWPFSYLAEQHFCLDDDGLSIDLTVANLSDRPMPCGFGWHPYFPATPQARVEAMVDGVWLTDDEIMPTAWCELPTNWNLPKGSLVAEMASDNLFTGWDGRARIIWPEHGVGLTIRASGNLGYLVVFTPPGENFFCVEPVSHCTDAFNRTEDQAKDQGVVVLPPGGDIAAGMRLQPYSL